MIRHLSRRTEDKESGHTVEVATRRGSNISRVACMAIVPLVALATVPAAFAEETPQRGVFALVLENDLFYDTDRNYTNGITFIWVPTGKESPDWALRVARSLPWFPEKGNVRHGYAFGQNMYTPRDITLTDPPRDDRPYAGWLYGTIGLGVETGRQQVDLLAFTLGVVGPASRAEQTQKFFHELFGADEPQGWDTQLGNELGILLTHQRSWRALATTTLIGFDADVTPHFGGALGNVYTYANAGLTLRYGGSLPPDYGPPRIQPGIQGSVFFAPTDVFAWYLFAGLEGRAVARNIFLDGNTFRDSRSVDKEPFVGDLQWGAVLAWRGVRLSYTHVVRTREFKTQGKHDEFGALNLSIAF